MICDANPLDSRAEARDRTERRLGRVDVQEVLAGAIALASLAAVPAQAQEQARLNWVKVHSPAIEGNLEGNSAERKVLVVTPPGYDENPNKRYPVVYYLHGYWAPVEAQQAGFKLHEAVQAAAEAGNALIMVMPDGFSKLRGGFYSSSPTVGDYESFVADDLVDWVDGNYRTIAARASRGLAGPLDGRLRHGPHRDEAPGDVLEHLHDERVLPRSDADDRRAGAGDRGDDARAGRRRAVRPARRGLDAGDLVARSDRRRVPQGLHRAQAGRHDRPAGQPAARGQLAGRARAAVPARAELARGLRDGHRRQGLPARGQPPPSAPSSTASASSTSSSSTRATTATASPSASAPKCCRSSAQHLDK